MPTIVLGLGNELLGDEGVGVHAVRLLQRENLPATIRMLEVGTAVLDAVQELEGAERVIILDAMKADGAPGTVYKIPLEDCQGSTCIASMHGFDIFRVMLLAGSGKIPPVTVFGVEPQRLDWSMELSPPVSLALPALLAAVRLELALPPCSS